MDSKSEQYLDISKENTLDTIIKTETVKTKRQHRRNSSLSLETSNRKQWLNSCFGRFKNFIKTMANTTPYKVEFTQWLGKIETLNMMYLSLEVTEDFQAALQSIKDGQENDKTRYYIDMAIKRLCLHHDIDLDYISDDDYDRLCRYMCLFCQSCIEDK